MLYLNHSKPATSPSLIGNVQGVDSTANNAGGQIKEIAGVVAEDRNTLLCKHCSMHNSVGSIELYNWLHCSACEVMVQP
jgi:hypothetical protein